jgi:uncharacterized protein
MIKLWMRGALAAAVLWLAVGAGLATAQGVVISQIYGGGGGGSPTFQNDFIELFNAGTTPVNLNGWSVQYAATTGSNWSATALPNVTLQPGRYFLIQQGGGANGGALPTPDATGTIAMSANAGKIALLNTTATLSGACPIGNPALIDFVGYGPGTDCFEGVGPTSVNLSAVASAMRLNAGCTDTGSNFADFMPPGPPLPRNSAFPATPCSSGGAIATTCNAFNTVNGVGGSSALRATDSDSVVNGVSITGGAVIGISLTPLNAALADGGVASVRIQVGSGVGVGLYNPVVTFTNDDGQSASCTVSISVLAAPASVTPIFTLQGPGSTSPMLGQARITRGVVTGVFPGIRGFYIQDETGDGNPLTSDGIFVFTNAAPITVEPGERVQVAGTVAEFAGFAGNPTVTQLSSISSIAKIGQGSIVPLPLALPEATDGDLERYEGMLVRITSVLTVSQNFFLGRYGQVTLSSDGRLFKPTQVFRPGTASAIALAEGNARRRIVLDDGQASESFFSGVENPNPIPFIGAENTLRAGDSVVDLTGIIDFGRITSAIGASAIVDYKLYPTVTPVFTRVNARTTTPPAVGGTLRVASFNVLNYFTTFQNGATASGQSGQGCLPSGTADDCRGANNLNEFNRQRDKIVRAIAALDADVVGLMEIQRNGGVATQSLVDALNAFVGGPVWAVVPDPANVGTDAIQVAMIYKPARLSLPIAALSDGNPVHNRPPVAQTFQAVAGGARFSVVVNHFKSKNCGDATGLDLDQGDAQGCFNERRRQQANALLAFVSTVQGAAADSDVLVIGDLNAYAQEDPMAILVAGGLLDQVLRFQGPFNYSYVFDGEAGSLDHALATASLAAQISGATHWAINTDEPSVIDYNTEFRPQDLYTVSPYRSSDHDPVLVGLQLAGAAAQTISFAPLADRPLGAGAFTLGASASSGLTVQFSSLTASICSVSVTTVTLLGTGLCTIAADQPGNAAFAPAPRVTRSFTITQGLLPQSIGFDPLPAISLGAAPFALTAAATSGLPVAFATLSPGSCAVSGNTVTLLAAGTCAIEARQPGDTVYAAAAPVQRSFDISLIGMAVASQDADVPLPPWAMLLLLIAFGAIARRANRH